jgi:hypothetical protein
MFANPLATDGDTVSGFRTPLSRLSSRTTLRSRADSRGGERRPTTSIMGQFALSFGHFGHSKPAEEDPSITARKGATRQHLLDKKHRRGRSSITGTGEHSRLGAPHQAWAGLIDSERSGLNVGVDEAEAFAAEGGTDAPATAGHAQLDPAPLAEAQQPNTDDENVRLTAAQTFLVARTRKLTDKLAGCAKSGFLVKEAIGSNRNAKKRAFFGDGVSIKNWKRRFFVLSFKGLSYFNDEHSLDRGAKGVLFLTSDSTVRAEWNGGGEAPGGGEYGMQYGAGTHIFNLVTTGPFGKSVRCQSSSHEEMVEWIQAIQRHILGLRQTSGKRHVHWGGAERVRYARAPGTGVPSDGGAPLGLAWEREGEVQHASYVMDPAVPFRASEYQEAGKLEPPARQQMLAGAGVRRLDALYAQCQMRALHARRRVSARSKTGAKVIAGEDPDEVERWERDALAMERVRVCAGAWMKRAGVTVPSERAAALAASRGGGGGCGCGGHTNPLSSNPMRSMRGSGGSAAAATTDGAAGAGKAKAKVAAGANPRQQAPSKLPGRGRGFSITYKSKLGLKPKVKPKALSQPKVKPKALSQPKVKPKALSQPKGRGGAAKSARAAKDAKQAKLRAAAAAAEGAGKETFEL